jgi:translation initiation factor IF-3
MKRKYRINSEILEKEVRIIGENKENISGIIEINHAIKIGEKIGLDLIEINNKVKPVICRYIDYDKLIFDEKKKLKEISKENKKNQIKTKEIRITPNISDNDVDYRIKNAKEFLLKKNKIKITMLFKGRAIKHIDLGKIVLLKFLDTLSDFSIPEYLPKLEGNKLHVIIKPK